MHAMGALAVFTTGIVCGVLHYYGAHAGAPRSHCLPLDSLNFRVRRQPDRAGAVQPLFLSARRAAVH